MAQTRSGILFGPYRLDLAGPRLWRGDEPVPLQPRPLAVLCHLAAQPGVVVGRDELIARLWGGTHVTRAVLKVAVRAIREALGDDADEPRYIETVGREGYRFIGGGVSAAPLAPRAAAPAAGAPAIVGRDGDLLRLHAALARAQAGQRAIVLVSGEAGIGKSTLLDRFLAEVDPLASVCVARGQCLEQYGEGEAYLPVLEALGSLARGPASGELSETLARHAPSWVSQLAALDPAPAARWRRDEAVATMPARMLRELADALEVFTARRTLVLALEDLHWSDPSSVELIDCLARRRPAARLLVVGTLRPVEAADRRLGGVLHELLAKGLCELIELGLLSRDEVSAYLTARFGGVPAADLRRLAARVHQRTEGNALFMIHMVNELVAEGLLAGGAGEWRIEGSIDEATEGVPSALLEVIGRGLRGLAPEQRQVLEAASVAGEEFAVAAVAAALESDEESVEDACEQLAAHGAFIVEAGVAEWPDGSVSGRYRFRHALYRHALYEGVAEARRVRLHRAIGRREEAGFGARAGDHAAELAMHFARGRDHGRALAFHEQAVAAALERHAPHEAVAHCGAALEALAHLPEDPSRAERELGLVVARATLLMAIRGYAATETEQAFARARLLCDAAPAGAQRYPVLRGLLSYHHVRAEMDVALALGEELLRYAAAQPDDVDLRVQAHYGHGATLFHAGDFGAARTHLEAALRDYDSAAHRRHERVYGGYDPGVACSLWLAWSRILQGDLAEAARHTRAGLELARAHGEAFSLAWAQYGVGVSHQLLGEWPASEAASAEGARMAEEQGFPHVLGMATVNWGWALLMQRRTAEGVARLREGVALVDRTGAALGRPAYRAMLAAADVADGDRASALARYEEGLAEMERTGERLHEAPLLIGKSRLLAAGGGRQVRAAETCLRRALEVARAQGARLVELRAAVALARHCRDHGRAAEARGLLQAAHAYFADRPAAAGEIAAARRLLAELPS